MSAMAHTGPVDIAELLALASGNAGDRAYADALVRMRWAKATDDAERDALEEVRAELASGAARAHTSMRVRIAEGTLRGEELRRCFDDVPLLERDHFVEEVLGIAYPPLGEPELEPGLVAYRPSGYDEIVHALDVTRLDPTDHFLDIGSGTGKVVLLAALLCGATSVGIELDPALIVLGSTSARALGLANVRFVQGDARDAPLGDADVVFLYLPFTGTVLAQVMQRLLERRRRFVCAGALDLPRYPQLVEASSPRSWLHVYAWA